MLVRSFSFFLFLSSLAHSPPPPGSPPYFFPSPPAPLSPPPLSFPPFPYLPPALPPSPFSGTNRVRPTLSTSPSYLLVLPPRLSLGSTSPPPFSEIYTPPFFSTPLAPTHPFPTRPQALPPFASEPNR